MNRWYQLNLKMFSYFEIWFKIGYANEQITKIQLIFRYSLVSQISARQNLTTSELITMYNYFYRNIHKL